MGGSSGTMRAGPARRDPDFRGIDTEALGHLIKQVKDATTAIKSWLNEHPLPPEVPRTGVRMATEVDLWASSQLGMLTRRRNYALTHPDRVHEMPRTGAPPLGSGAGKGIGKGIGKGPGKPTGSPDGKSGGRRPRHTTPSGAGPHLGNFPTQQAAAKAAADDVLAFRRARAEHAAPPDAVWRRLGANADDPDYTAAFYTRLGGAGTAALIAAAHHDRARLAVISESLGTGSHHAPIDESWLRALLAEAGPAQHAEVVRVLRDADLSDKSEAALRRLGDLDAPGSQVLDAGRPAPGQADACPPRAR
ncbi:MAG TPA: hypothetical protein VFU43_22810 [Streptosporangiaceae bacterium]|nr:hypothetical protein [Streptosporangiaceae bacterium]